MTNKIYLNERASNGREADYVHTDLSRKSDARTVLAQADLRRREHG